MFCSKCGSEVLGNARFCSRCGWEITGSSLTSSDYKPADSSNGVIDFLLAGLLILAGLSGFVSCTWFIISLAIDKSFLDTNPTIWPFSIGLVVSICVFVGGIYLLRKKKGSNNSR